MSSKKNTKDSNVKEKFKKYGEKLDNICEECKKEDESVSQNLMMNGYKICGSCKISKTIFPVWYIRN